MVRDRWLSEAERVGEVADACFAALVSRAADIVVTMGCGDACPVYPGKRYLDWELADPTGLTVAEVRPAIADLTRSLLTNLLSEGPTKSSLMPGVTR
jgi:hypothetical protein